MTLLVAALSMKSVPLTRLARPRLAASKLTPVMLRVDLPVSLKVSFSVSPPSRLMPLNEASWAVVVIWGHDAVVLAHQVAADGLRLQVGDRCLWRRPGQRAGDGSADRTARFERPEGRGSVVVAGGDHQFAGRIDGRLQVVGLQLGVQLIQRLDRAAGAVAEGDVDRCAAVEGGEGQGLAGERAGVRRTDRVEHGRVALVAAETERRQRVAGSGDRQVGPDSGRDLQLAARGYRRRGGAGRGRQSGCAVGGGGRLAAGREIDGVEHVGDRRAPPDRRPNCRCRR